MPVFNFKEIFELYQTKQFEALSKCFIDLIKYFNNTCYTSIAREERVKWDNAVLLFLHIFTQPDFQIPAQYANVFVNLNHIIANMAIVSSFESPEPFLRRVSSQDNNYVKLLTLATCITPLEVDFDALFAPNPKLASLWWLNYQTAAMGTLTQGVHDRIVKQLQSVPAAFVLPDLRTAPMYFQSTYYSPETDHIIKQALNKQIRIKLAGAKVHTNPRSNSIAILSDRWQPTTAVYKSCYHQIAKLAEKYELTLVHFSEDKASKIDHGLFKQVKRVFIQPDMQRIDFSEIKNNDFQLAYFPDIGMNYESVCLSNMQVAPIMATGYGHPVSTFGSKVDYFIGGLDSEVPELAERNYSERLVLVPGIGAHPVFPNYVRKNPTPSEFLINCCWTTPKINYPMLDALREIKRRATRPVKFQFFPSWTAGRYQGTIPLLRGLETFFEGASTLYFDTPYHEYLELLENGRFSLDSYPFGGYNTVVDSMFVGCPVVTLEGTRFFNRASSALMRKVGLPELITSNREHYITKALLLIDNPQMLQNMRDQVTNTDLKTLLVDTDEPQYFANAIDYLIANHTELKTQSHEKPLILA